MNASELVTLGFHNTEGASLVSDEILEILNLVIIICIPILGVPGVVFNVINVIVFAHMGLTDTTNISLLGLAVADIGSQVTMIGGGIIYNPLTVAAVSSKETLAAIDYDLVGAPHNTFSRISGLLTGFISIERCVCVVWPLHVKALFTKQRTSVAVLGAYTFMFASTIPTFIAHPMVMKLDPVLNITVVGLFSEANSDQLENISISVSVTAQMTSFAVVTVTTLFLTRSLHAAAQWRGSIAGQVSKATSRDKKLVKMVILISTVFIAFSLPTILVYVLIQFLQDFTLNGRNNTFIKRLCVVLYALHAISTTVNIFIYLAVSSKFKRHFYTLFGSIHCKEALSTNAMVRDEQTKSI